MIKSSARLLPPAQADAERQRSQQQQQQEQEQRPRQRRRPLGLGDNVIAVNQPAQPLLRTESSFSFSLAKPRAGSTTDHTGHCRTVGAGHRSDQRSAVSRAKEARDSTGSRSRRILQLSFGSLSLPLDQEDTPSDLRRLEKGWREKRRVWADSNLSLSGRRRSHALNTDHRAGNGENGGQDHSDGGGLSIDMGKGAESVRAVSVPMNAIRGRPLPTQMDINSEEEGKWELLDPALMEPAASQIEREQALLRSNHQPHPHRRCQIKSSRTSMKTARPSGARTTQAQNVRFSVTPPSVLPTPPPSPPQPSPRRVATISSQEGDGALVNDAGLSRPARAGRLRHRRPPFCQPSEKPPLGGRDEGGDGDSNGGTTSPSLSPRASLARTRHVQSDHPSSIPASSSGRIQAQAQARTRPEAEAQKPFTPILADPLPPTLRPVPISKADSDTIYVHPLSSPLELTLHLQGGRRIEVYRGGLEVRLSDRRYTEGEEEKQDEEPEKVRTVEGRMMKLEESDYWTKEERTDWANLAGVVEGFKRITPRVSKWLSAPCRNGDQ
ncbi:hypothetical protein I316_05894 [Kwoniella heveanensis BCC8398]|uniref:Uncharacterized protein n=1 Tax=Kwoniella heveanensis BCC8398 TaxID=1296120 RepID=A0A1B9GN97_9TREE|nr:hypothetical protein I316_05894 [Kwoniella heveanensis BCC8398]